MCHVWMKNYCFHVSFECCFWHRMSFLGLVLPLTTIWCFVFCLFSRCCDWYLFDVGFQKHGCCFCKMNLSFLADSKIFAEVVYHCSAGDAGPVWQSWHLETSARLGKHHSALNSYSAYTAISHIPTNKQMSKKNYNCFSGHWTSLRESHSDQHSPNGGSWSSSPSLWVSCCRNVAQRYEVLNVDAQVLTLSYC